MVRLICFITFIYFAGSVSANPQSYATYLLPKHRSNITPLKSIEELPLGDYEFQIVPSDQYAVADYLEPQQSLSLFDMIPLPSPITALVKVASTALSVATWLLSNSGFIVLGAALLFGFCAFTPYCTLVIESPFTSQIRSLNIPYLDDVECFFRQAYEKYHT